MDTTKPSAIASTSSSPFSCTPAVLSGQLHNHAAPLIVDVRKNDPYLASNYTLPGAIRRDPLQVEVWADALPTGTSILVYCVYGHEVGMNTMLALRAKGLDANFLEGGIEAWREQGFPLAAKTSQSNGESA